MPTGMDIKMFAKKITRLLSSCSLRAWRSLYVERLKSDHWKVMEMMIQKQGKIILLQGFS